MRRLLIRLAASASLLVLALLGWLGWLRTLPKRPPEIQFVMLPRYTIPTGHAVTRYRKGGTHPSIADISDDGSRVIVGLNWWSTNGFGTSEFEIWDAAANRNVTPAHWNDPDWKEIITAPRWLDSGLAQVVATPDGRNFARDGDAWATLRERLAKQRSHAIETSRHQNRATDCKGRIAIPRDASFSSDGRFLAYRVSKGLALEFVDEYDGDGTVVEDIATGMRVATLSGLTQRIRVAPGGRTAVSFDHPVDGDGEQPRMKVWDLESSKPRADLLIVWSNFDQVQFSEDGRYIFVQYNPYHSYDQYRRMRWWDITTGRQCGDVVNCYNYTLFDSDRILVTNPLQRTAEGRDRSSRLLFWDVQTGRQVGEWNLTDTCPDVDSFNLIRGSNDGRFLAVDFDPPYPDGFGPRGLQGIVLPKPPPKAPQHTILLDVANRREVGRYLGGSPHLSRDGRWLATADDGGVVRVWEMPL